MTVVRALLGISFFLAVAWALSDNRKRFPVRVVVGGLVLQIALALFCIKTSVGVAFFQSIAGFVQKLIQMAQPGVSMVFGNLSEGNFAEGGWGFPFAFAASGLPVIMFFSALMAILYHLGVMQLVIYGLAQVMTKLMGVSGAESMSMAANVFVGQTEAPLVVKPYIPGMTRSELNAMMTGGFATIAGSVLAVYLGLLGEEYGPHLITASVMSAPAAFLIAKVMVPETEVPATGSNIELRVERSASNVVEAAANGTSDGLKLWLNVIAMLIAFMGLVAMLDWFLGAIREGLTLNTVLSYLFAPVAWVMGVEGWHDCQLMGSLLGTKVAVNEFLAFDGLLKINQATGEAAFASQRTAIMASYALCGFANFASVGIQIGGITPLAPEKRSTIAGLAVRAMLGGAFASWMTATVAGMFL
ncbi:MAG: NupC/NupG family nucleoside CNT transporter [Planctomycetota bacterium]|nr:NupC/NupG family nucleoside CNT transporter [Planctomycetota bacterium]